MLLKIILFAFEFFRRLHMLFSLYDFLSHVSDASVFNADFVNLKFHLFVSHNLIKAFNIFQGFFVNYLRLSI